VDESRFIIIATEHDSFQNFKYLRRMMQFSERFSDFGIVSPSTTLAIVKPG
jgi:hypothetical protein